MRNINLMLIEEDFDLLRKYNKNRWVKVPQEDWVDVGLLAKLDLIGIQENSPYHARITSTGRKVLRAYEASRRGKPKALKTKPLYKYP